MDEDLSSCTFMYIGTPIDISDLEKKWQVNWAIIWDNLMIVALMLTACC